VTSFAANQGPGARVLWCVRRRTCDVRCVLIAGANPIEVQVLQDRDLVLKELFFDEPTALAWADEYYARLKEHGWRDSPADIAPSSVA
jgi:hypothetical protein